MSRALERTLRKFAEIGSGVPVYPGNTMIPRPPNVYGTLLKRRDDPIGYPDPRADLLQLNPDEDGLQALEDAQEAEAAFSLQFYRCDCRQPGPGAMDAALSFRAYAGSEPGLIFALLGRQPDDTGEPAAQVPFRLGLPLATIRRLDGVVGPAWEERAVIDLTVRYIFTASQNVEVVETLVGDLQVGSYPGSGDPDIVLELEVNTR